MAITMRKGNDEDFNPNRIIPGEIAVVLDEQKLYIKFNSSTKEILLTEDAENLVTDLIAQLALSKTSPVGTGSLSLNRKADTTIGTYSAVVGSMNEASAVASFALGLQNKASAASACALGGGNEASGIASAAIGMENKAEGNYSAAIGEGNRSIDEGCVSVGKFSSVRAPGMRPRVFQVGNGTDISHRHTAFEIDADGNAFFYGNISAPMFTYDNGVAVQIGVDNGGNPVKRMTVFGTDTSSWSESGQTVMELESRNVIIINAYGYIQIYDGANNISVSISSAEIHDKNVVIKLPNGLKSATAKYCITVEYILLS